MKTSFLYSSHSLQVTRPSGSTSRALLNKISRKFNPETSNVKISVTCPIFQSPKGHLPELSCKGDDRVSGYDDQWCPRSGSPGPRDVSCKVSPAGAALRPRSHTPKLRLWRLLFPSPGKTGVTGRRGSEISKERHEMRLATRFPNRTPDPALAPVRPRFKRLSLKPEESSPAP